MTPEDIETADTLTDRQRAFIDAYLVTLNASEAARRAGYSEESARFVGSENLTKPNIQAAIDEAMRERAKRVHVEQDDVVRELMRIAFSDVTNYGCDDAGNLTVTPDAPADATRAVASYKFTATRVPGTDRQVERCEFRLWDKMKALELAGKHLGMFVERHEVAFAGMPRAQLEAEAERRGIRFHRPRRDKD